MRSIRIAFVANPTKQASAAVLKKTMADAEALGCACYQLPDTGTLQPDYLTGIDLLVVIGGDGTILKGAVCAALCDVPVLGVNLGRVGFLSEIQPEDFYEALSLFLAGRAPIEARMMLYGTINGLNEEHLCLNELMLYKRTFSGVAYIGIDLDGRDAGNIFCDGLVVSTPTGATGYSISAGGPIIAPGLDAAIVTPICPHSLCARPIVAAADATITLKMLSEGAFYADGRFVSDLQEGDSITVTRSQTQTRFVRVADHNLYKLIREKLI